MLKNRYFPALFVCFDGFATIVVPLFSLSLRLSPAHTRTVPPPLPTVFPEHPHVCSSVWTIDPGAQSLSSSRHAIVFWQYLQSFFSVSPPTSQLFVNSTLSPIIPGFCNNRCCPLGEIMHLSKFFQFSCLVSLNRVEKRTRLFLSLSFFLE